MMRGFLMAAVGLLAGCSAMGAASAGPDVRRELAVPGRFSAIAVRGPDDVRVVEGDRLAIVAQGPGDALDRLEVTLDGSTLVIRRKDRNGWNWTGTRHLAHITVTAPALSAATLGGSGDLLVAAMRGATVAMSLAGSGDLRAERIEAGEIQLTLAGSGDLYAKGRADSVRASIAGSGDIYANELDAGAADVSLVGSGDARIRSRRAATISLVGSGDVTVAGTRDCRISKHGSGDVRCEG